MNSFTVTPAQTSSHLRHPHRMFSSNGDHARCESSHRRPLHIFAPAIIIMPTIGIGFVLSARAGNTTCGGMSAQCAPRELMSMLWPTRHYRISHGMRKALQRGVRLISQVSIFNLPSINDKLVLQRISWHNRLLCSSTNQKMMNRKYNNVIVKCYSQLSTPCPLLHVISSSDSSAKIKLPVSFPCYLSMLYPLSQISRALDCAFMQSCLNDRRQYPRAPQSCGS